MNSAPRAIADYGLVGDGKSTALIDRGGNLAWLCWPRFDSQAIFAGLLGDAGNGIWTIAPAQTFRTTRQYRPDTLILETRFSTTEGEALLTDFMPCQDRPQSLIRRLRCVKGRATMRSRFAPRLNYGVDKPRYSRQGAKLLVCGDDISLALQSTRSELLYGERPLEFTLDEGQEIDFMLSDADVAPVVVATYARMAEQRCARFWQTWAARCTYQGPWRKAVVRSLLTLKALVHAPSGAIVAAPTASLPERMGGHRNWDYRYCWLRDSTFTVLALLHAGYLEEAGAWVNWLIRRVGPETDHIEIFYGIAPHTETNEFEAPWLNGFNGSRPVRFGNGAQNQLQLGVYGEIQDTLHQWRLVTGKRERTGWQVQKKTLKWLHSLIGKPDAGIWEQRRHQEFFTQSRALAWVAFDRALKTADRLCVEQGPAWQANRAQLHAEVCEQGYDQSLGSFSRAYGSRSLDASNLLLAMVGFLPADDPRIVGTVRAIRRHLCAGPFVYRYDAMRERDGVGGPEGAFLPCSYWLADNLILQGRENAAAAIFESLFGVANDLGLYSEEYDVSEKCLLGNFPQALTHLSLVHTALNLTGEGPVHSRSNVAH